MRILAVLLVVACLTGCSQKITYREYYEPNASTIFKRSDGTSVGAVKTEIEKDGMPDWSSGKSLNLSAF